MSVPAEMMQGGPPPPEMMGGGPPMGPSGIPPNLLPFASTQPGGVTALAAPLLQQQQLDLEAFKKQQLEAAMAVIMQSMAQLPNELAQGAQTEPSPPMGGMPAPGADPMEDPTMAGGY